MDRKMAALGLTMVLSACSGTGGTDHPAAADFSIEVQGAWTTEAIGSLTPDGGDQFLEVSVDLANQTHARPISAAFAFFTVKTTDSLVLQPNATANSIVEPACSGDVSVAAGGSFTCSVVFEIASDQTPSALDFSEPEALGSASASAAIHDVMAQYRLSDGIYDGAPAEDVVNTCSQTFGARSAHVISHDVHGNVLIDKGDGFGGEEVFVMSGNTGTWTSPPQAVSFCGATDTFMDVITFVSDDHFDLKRTHNLTGIKNDGSQQCDLDSDTCTYSYLQHWSYHL